MCSSIRNRVNACVQALAKQMAELQRPGLLKASRACNISDAIDTQLSSFAPPHEFSVSTFPRINICPLASPRDSQVKAYVPPRIIQKNL